MVASLDAMIFVTVLALVAVTLISAGQPVDEGPDASKILDDMDKVRLGSDHIVEDGGDIGMDLWSMYAASASSGDTSFITGYMTDVVSDTLKGRYGFIMDIEYGGRVYTFGKAAPGGYGDPVSECDRTFTVLGGGELRVGLRIY